jgi:hypothetical protein
MAAIGSLTLTGASGASYTFQIFPWNTTFNPVAAVYVVTKRLPAENGDFRHDVLYVGETGSLSERFASHHKADAMERRQANCINVLQERNAEVRLRIEADLIASHNPPCNG